jgi:ribosomal protein S18 acetylase RimI-like enzyme
MEVRRVRGDEWEALRDMRLRALADAPDAFKTTHDDAAGRPERWWREWADASAGGRGQAMFLAWEAGKPIGIAGAYGGPERFDVISMWTDPAWRGRGVAAALLRAAVDFAGDAPVYLSVTETNDAARRLYERHGFELTGVSEPLRAGASLQVYELRLRR